MKGIIRQKSIMPGAYCHQNHLRISINRAQVQIDSIGFGEETPPRSANPIRIFVTNCEVTEVGFIRDGTDIELDIRTPIC